MTNHYKDCRKSKRRMNRIQKKYREGSYVISCNGHPSIVTKKENYKAFYNQRWAICEGEYTTKSLIDGREDSCSVYNCGLIAESKERIEGLAHDTILKNEGKISEYDFNLKWHGKVWADKVKRYNDTGEWEDEN